MKPMDRQRTLAETLKSVTVEDVLNSPRAIHLICADSGADARSVRRVLLNQPHRPTVGERVREAAKGLGLEIPPPPAAPKQDTGIEGAK
jgi:hypothetical protein